jgi:hypothetical protein
MIEWIKYERTNPPNLNQDTAYLITDGRHIDLGWHSDEIEGEEPRWYVPDSCPVGEDHITHYAVINLPGEETQ